MNFRVEGLKVGLWLFHDRGNKGVKRWFKLSNLCIFNDVIGL